jgi:hypothetical protein
MAMGSYFVGSGLSGRAPEEVNSFGWLKIGYIVEHLASNNTSTSDDPHQDGGSLEYLGRWIFPSLITHVVSHIRYNNRFFPRSELMWANSPSREAVWKSVSFHSNGSLSLLPLPSEHMVSLSSSLWGLSLNSEEECLTGKEPPLMG